MYTALLRNSTVLVNTTKAATITLNKEGNYSCVATNKYGTNVKAFSVIFPGNFVQALSIGCFTIFSSIVQVASIEEMENTFHVSIEL